MYIYVYMYIYICICICIYIYIFDCRSSLRREEYCGIFRCTDWLHLVRFPGPVRQCIHAAESAGRPKPYREKSDHSCQSCRTPERGDLWDPLGICGLGIIVLSKPIRFGVFVRSTQIFRWKDSGFVARVPEFPRPCQALQKTDVFHDI